MTDDQFLSLQTSEAHAFAENLLVQRDDTLTRIAAAAADKQAALSTAAAAAASASAAAVKAATDPLNQEIATLNATVTTLNARVADLTTRLSGAKGAYQISVLPIHEAAMEIEAAAHNTTAVGWLTDGVYQMLVAMATKNDKAILQLALSKYPTLAVADQQAILAALGLSFLSGLSIPEQMTVLAEAALPRFMALQPEVQNAIAGHLGL